MNIIYCVCGKMCTSLPGLTLHQRSCPEVLDAKKENKPITKETNIIQPKIKYIGDIDEFVRLVEIVANDAHIALTENNRSAGRRARTGFIRIRDMITPIRKQILDKLKK